MYVYTLPIGSVCSLSLILVDVAPFSSFRALFSTGAVLTPPMFRWVYQVFPKHIHLVVTSGGTDVCAACRCNRLSAKPD